MHRLAVALAAGWYLLFGLSPAVESPPQPSPGIERALATVQVLERQFKPSEGGVLRAENSGHRISTRVTPAGVELTRGRGTPAERQVELRLVAATRGEERREISAGATRLESSRAEIHRPGLPLVEWYVNDLRGVEQGLDVERDPLPGEGVLRFVFETRGTLSPTESTDGRSIELHAANGTLELELGALVATDASQRKLPARMRMSDGALVYEVDDRGASYPIVVDPLATAPNFSYTATLDVATRVSISTAGDVNGDGYSDLLIGAVSTYLFLGSASGLAATPAWQADLSQPFLLPQSVSTAGDVNGDGYDDMLLVTAVLVAPGVVGSAYLFLGSPSIASRADGTLLNADWVVRGSQAGDWTTGEYVYFISATLAGDLNGDGFSDVVVGFPGFDGASNAGREGVIGVWLGSADIATRPDGTLANCDWRADGAPGGNIPTVNSGTGFGSAVSTAGDVNGDGFDDLIAGSPASALGGGDWGGAFVWLGSSAFASRPDGTFANSDWAFAPVHGSGALSFSGATVAAAGDVDGDGLADVLVSRHYPPSVVGPTTDILLFRGDATLALQATPSFSTSGPTETVGTSYQVRAATAGDVNGDGLADIVVGFPAQTVDGYFNAGEVRVFLGRRGTVPSTTPAAVWDGAGTEERFGASVGTAGDVNGDGFSDVAATGMTARVFHGGGDSVTLVADFPFTVSDGNAGGASPVVGLGLGFAGDINGDGYGDAVVGVPGADHLPLIDPGRFEVLYGAACGLRCAVFYVSGPGYFEGSQAGEFMGWSVTGAGDVNGDGYADVIAGAPNYDATVSATTRVDAGRARIYYGTSSGLAFSAFTALPGPETTSAHFGMAVAGAGDVNGDGLRDVIVGAPDADSGGLTDNGAVYVYLGNAGGVTAVPVWSKTGTRSGARLGASVASAGDTNSDGYSDVIIGADGDGTDHQGAAYVYLGGVAGLATTEVWTREGTWNGDAYGTSVASAGDTNGDGYSDIIVGQPVFKVGPEFASRASIYFGSALGPEPYTNTILFGQYGLPDRFGSGVASAGDVDGDGFSDVIIGAQWTNGAHGSYQGRAYVFHGCSDGICTLGQTLDDCPSAPCDFGRDVAGGGDVNGDGFADVMIGAFSLDTSVGPGQGTAFVHFGNGGTGAERTIQQLGYYGLPIDLLGSAGATGQVRPFMVLHSAAGRSRVQLETELRPLDTDFTGVGTAISPLLDTNLSGQPASNLMACGLNQVCHWRARVRSRNPYFPRSPWFSPPGNALTETDVRGPTAPDADGDGIADAVDNCRSVANFDQLDTDVGGGDGVGDACDNCALVSNARVPGGGPAYLVANPWATLTGEQRDDDHDGYGNTCDADFVGTTFFANNADTAQYKASIAGTHLKYKDNCGTSATMPCAIFDLNSGNSTEATTIGISNADTARFKALLAAPARPGPRCPTCPLACTAGTAGSC